MQAQWHYLGRSGAFRDRTPARALAGEVPLVLVRERGSLRAFPDRCPHRGFALSEACAARPGEPALRCPYHGWAFDGEGRLVERPGFDEAQAPAFRLPRYAVAEAGGLVFAHPDEATPAPRWIRDLGEPGVHTILVENELSAGALATMENLLDPFHTHFVHGWMLRTGPVRHPVDVTATYRSPEQELTMEYFNEPRPTGLVSRLFEKERGRTLGRYHHRNAAVLEYWGPRELDLRVTMSVSELEHDRLRGVIVFQVRMNPFAFLCVKPLLLLFSRILVAQDRRALEKLHANEKRFPGKGAWAGPEDVVLTTMRQLHEGLAPASFEKRLRMRL